jgi:hypothetical protein
VLALLDAEPPEPDQERALWRMRLAERRMREAYLALEVAEQQGVSSTALQHLADVFSLESAVYGAALDACPGRLPSAHLGRTCRSGVCSTRVRIQANAVSGRMTMYD